ncbi:MAG: PQQ-dependent sugar dehydrogenase [Acidobacteria bacterium]|nr:PQQ-dependent sugar dehydrogenase [Acidobacteriota bacterium]
MHPAQLGRWPVAGLTILLSALAGSAPIASGEAILSDGFALEDVITSSLDLPTSIAFAQGGGDLLYIAEKGGKVRVIRDGQLRARPFVDLSSEVNQFGDRGLAGVAVHPEFPVEPFVYLSFSWDPPDLPGAEGEADGPDGKGRRVSRLVRVTANASTDYETMVEGSLEVIFGAAGTLEVIGDAGPDDLQPLCERNGRPIDDCAPSESHSHGINSISFGPDGALWFSHGDGSNALTFDKRALRAQNLDSLSGKILRVDPMTGDGLPDNPFFDGNPTHNISKVWNYGVRNPFRLAFHPKTGELFAGDVGWNSWEEIDAGRGKNFGWPCFEGPLPQPAFQNHTETAEACAELYESDVATPPIHHYRRSPSGGALILGDFYTGDSWPKEFRDALFFADFNDQWIRLLVANDDGTWSARPFAFNLGAVVQILSGPDKNFYVVTIYPGAIQRLVYNGSNRPPQIVLDATPRSGAPPLEVHFSSHGTDDPDGEPLEFFWDLGDGTTSHEPHPVHTYVEPRFYRVRLTVSDPSGGTASSEIEIGAGASSPTAEIISPERGTTFSIGDEIELRGRANDPEEGELGEERLEWNAVLHHASHVHPDHFSGKGGSTSMELDDHGDDTWIELTLTATDEGGASGFDRVAIHPRTGSLVLDTNPSGLQLVYGSESLTTPFFVEPPVGGSRVISAPAVQNHRSFVRWSDGGNRSRSVVIDGTLQSLIAYYENRPPEAVVQVTITGENRQSLVCLGESSRDPEGDELRFLWDFGDGTQSNAMNPTHTYASPGRYFVTLTVTDALGSSDQVTVRVSAEEASRRRAVGRR